MTDEVTPAAEPSLRLEWIDPKDLKDNPENWRTHPSEQTTALKDVIDQVGWAGALLYNETTGHIIDGHARKKVSSGPVPVLIGSWTPEQERLILATLDPLAAMATADNQALGELLAGVETESDAVKSLLENLAKDHGIDLFQENLEPTEDAGAELDRAAELQEKWHVERGQLWVIGNHRLLCGDSTVQADVELVMDAEMANAVLTDPPYGIDQPGVPHDTPEEHRELMKGAVAQLPIENGVVVAFQSTRTFPTWLDAMREAGFKFERILTLYKEAQCTYPWRGWILKSESILISSIGNPRWQDVKPYAHDTYKVAEVSGESVPEHCWHGSIKPVAVVRDIMNRICTAGDLVYDPFLGSGTTMVAAEQLGRRCFGIEIEPKYCSVILERMEKLGCECSHTP